MAHRKQQWSKRVKKERFEKKFLSRMQATRLLQMDAINFRRLCILKGIYPRAIGRSKQKASGTNKQYYLAREIKWLVHDQIPERMFAFRAWEKKVRRAAAMQKAEDLKVLHSTKVRPNYSLVATIKERYPFFIDAVKDIDDAMSMIALYAFLSPEIRSNTNIELHHALPSGLHEKAVQTLAQWNRYVANAQVLAKGFISIKGYYYEAIIKGERVRWLCPHEYAHKFPSGIQQYVLIAFLEFHVELMRFILYKLEKDLERELEEEVKRDDETLRVEGDDLVGANTEDFGVATNVEVGQPGRQQDRQQKASRFEMVQKELDRVRRTFSGLVFYLSREVPEKHCSLVIQAAGGRVSSTLGPHVTHVVIDRPALPPNMEQEDRVEYVQPQYLFDCLNARAQLPAAGYRIGEALPPHVSPFTVSITNTEEDIAALEDIRKKHPKIVSYVPERIHEIRKFLNPGYVSVDPRGTVAQLDADMSSDDEHVAMPAIDRDDMVALDHAELKAARQRPQWRDEQVAEEVERTKLSAFQVQKQRELNLMNQPTSDMVAARRQMLAKAKELQRKTEKREDRIKRKLAEKERQDRATKKMQLQVARKKAARYYRMVNGVVESNKKKESLLAAKAQQLKEGSIRPDADGKTILNRRLETRKAQAAAQGKEVRSRKAASPYKKLPKWVQ